jgi:hypothetical protein
MGAYDWRLAATNVWKVERMLLDFPHKALASSNARFKRLRDRYRAYRATHDGRKPLYYHGRDRWTEIPAEFRN